MGSPRLFWLVTMAVIPTVAPVAAGAQVPGGTSSPDLGRNEPSSVKVVTPQPRKPARRGRSGTSTRHLDRTPTNDWNPHYFAGKDLFIEGHYEQALTEFRKNVADCDHIDFEAMGRTNEYFEHISSTIPGMGQSPHAFIRASNLQWVGAALAALAKYDEAEAQFTEMQNYAQKCYQGKPNTFEGCACQGLAYLLAARGQYPQAAERYRLALAHIEGNQAQIGLPPAPCVTMILVALADVELACGQVNAAEKCIRRAEHVQEAQRQLGIGPAPLDRAAFLTVFAQLRRSQLRDSEAYELYANALAIFRNISQQHPSAAYCLDGMGEIDLARGRLDQSGGHFRESLAVREAILGDTHPEVAYSLDGLARVAAARGKLDEANTLSRRASAILARKLGLSHPDVVALATNLKPPDNPATPDQKPVRPRARFLALPTFVTVGWQVLHLGKDWRAVEATILYRELKEAKSTHHAAVQSRAATTGH